MNGHGHANDMVIQRFKRLNCRLPNVDWKLTYLAVSGNTVYARKCVGSARRRGRPKARYIAAIITLA